MGIIVLYYSNTISFSESIEVRESPLKFPSLFPPISSVKPQLAKRRAKRTLEVLTRAELRAHLILVVPTMVDGVAHQVVVDADVGRAALEPVPAARLLNLLERSDEQLEAVLGRSPGIRLVLEGHKVGARVHEAAGAERVDRLFAREVGLGRKRKAGI